MRLDELDIPDVTTQTFYWIDTDSFEVGTCELFSVSNGWGSGTVYDYDGLEEPEGYDREYFESESDRDEWLSDEVPRLWKEEKEKNAELERELFTFRRTVRELNEKIAALEKENAELKAPKEFTQDEQAAFSYAHTALSDGIMSYQEAWTSYLSWKAEKNK